MTNTRTVHVTCPSCHAQGEFTVYKSINTKESPALKEKVRDGSLFQFSCLRREDDGGLPVPLPSAGGPLHDQLRQA